MLVSDCLLFVVRSRRNSNIQKTTGRCHESPCSVRSHHGCRSAKHTRPGTSGWFWYLRKDLWSGSWFGSRLILYMVDLGWFCIWLIWYVVDLVSGKFGSSEGNRSNVPMEQSSRNDYVRVLEDRQRPQRAYEQTFCWRRVLTTIEIFHHWSSKKSLERTVFHDFNGVWEEIILLRKLRLHTVCKIWMYRYSKHINKHTYWHTQSLSSTSLQFLNASAWRDRASKNIPMDPWTIPQLPQNVNVKGFPS